MTHHYKDFYEARDNPPQYKAALVIPHAPEFVPYPKTPRLRRDVVITEKIDGTNAAIGINASGAVWAQSRKKIIAPGKTTDNYGFAAWVDTFATELYELLGPGLHFGEWWGSGIQRGYGFEHRAAKRFSLFNTSRWAGVVDMRGYEMGLHVVPVLAEGVLSDALIDGALEKLRHYGSYAAPGFMNPEGICVFHTASNSVFKVLLENDDQHKGEAA